MTGPIKDHLLRLAGQPLKARLSRMYFTSVKLPLMLIAIMLGFVIEFLLELPFIFLMLLGYRSGKKGKNPGCADPAPDRISCGTE